LKNYIYDGSFQGFLTLIYTAFFNKDSDINIISSKKNSVLLFDSIFIDSDIEKANKVVKKIKLSFSKNSMYNIVGAFLSNQSGIENYIFSYITLGLKYGKLINSKLDENSVLKVLKNSERTYKEAHKIKGLLRFKELSDNSFYAPIFPDNNILPIIYRHFEERFSNQNWVIHDIRRKTCVIYTNKSSVFYDSVIAEESVLGNCISVLSSEELMFQSLWKNYFNSISIKDRINLKLQMKFVPKKYRNYITEMES
jgi:probable DNA metabolism protein